MFGVTSPLYEDLVYNREEGGTRRNILVAGTSGSGKSVILNGLINSILYEDAAKHQIALIDLKIVEFSKYKNLPHCIGCATSARETEYLLTHIINTIKTRLTEMEKRGSTNFTEQDGPIIHLIVDEMAELMLDGKECANQLQRICQIGRAAGVQVVCATQCPLASVIPTRIKVNFQITIGLHTRTAQDSRNILEENGCEKLPMYGQALIVKPGKATEKIDVPMIPAEWLEKIIAYRMAT